MDLTDVKGKYEEIQRRNLNNIENIRKNNNELLMKKNTDLEFMNKILESYQNLLLKVRSENIILENEASGLRNLLEKGNVSDRQLVMNLIGNLTSRQEKKTQLSNDLMGIVERYEGVNGKSAQLLGQEKEARRGLEKRIQGLEEELVKKSFEQSNQAPQPEP